MKKKIALIFGVTGQDGSYLSEYLLKKNYKVHGVKRKSSLLNTHRIDHIYDDPNIKGKTGIREYENQKSNFCIKSYAEDALESLIKNSNFRYILLSYNSEGIISERKLEKLLKSYSNKLFKKYRFDYRRYKKDKKTNKDKLYELIHVIDKN